MTGEHLNLNLVEASRRALDIVIKARDLEQLYRQALRYTGRGELRTRILELALQAMEEDKLKEQIFSSDDSLLSFLCGIWIQFLLIEIAGVKKENLRALAKKVFMEIQEKQSLH